MRIVTILGLLLAVSAAPIVPAIAQTAPPPAVQESEAPIVAEARAFMEGYARDLSAGSRAAIAARYDRRGAFLQGLAGDVFGTHADIVRLYAGPQWTPPAAFAWRQLRFDPVGADAVLVTGRFDWTRTGGAARAISYSALLMRQDGQLRIRLEHESPVPPRP